MAVVAWVMMGLAIWHFTIWLPDHFVGGIVGAFLAAALGAVLSGLILNGFAIPSEDALKLATPLEAIPGTLIVLGIAYFAGQRRGVPA
jgi:hypothetical protein